MRIWGGTGFQPVKFHHVSCHRQDACATRLFHDLEGCLLSVAASRTGEQSSNGVNSLAVATDDSSDIALPHLKLEDGHAATGDFRKHNLVRKLDELPDDELEELFHINLNCSGAL